MQTQTKSVLLNNSDIAAQLRETFPFSVDKYRLSGPDNLPTDHFGLFRSDSMACIGSAVKSGYEPHTLDDVSALVEASSEAFGGTSEVKASWYNGHFITVAPSADHQRSVWDHHAKNGSLKDVYVPRMIIKASYDGKAFSAEFGIFRMICRNLMAVPVQGRCISRKIRHTAALRDKMPNLIEDFRNVLSHGENVYAAIDNAQRKKVDMAAFIREVYPVSDDATKNTIGRAERRIEAIMSRLYRERRQLGIESTNPREATAWEAHNAIQGYVQHDAPRKKSPSSMDRIVLSLADKAVAKSGELAFA